MTMPTSAGPEPNAFTAAPGQEPAGPPAGIAAPTPQSIQDEKITDLLNAASEEIHETSAGLRRDIQLLQSRVNALEQAVEVNTKLTKGIGDNTKEILDVFASFQGAMRVLEMIGKLAKPLGYIVGACAAAVGFWTALKTGGAGK